MSDNYNATVKELVDSYGNWWENGFDIPQMTNELYPYENIFSPIKINRLTVKNRLVMAPMGNISMAEETGRPNERMISYFAERAKGGVGLITSGLVPISFGIDSSLIELDKLSYFPRIDRSRTRYGAWRDIAAKCHAHDAVFFIQLTPGLGRVGNPQCLITQKKLPVSASWNPNFYMPAVPCKRLSNHSLNKIIKNAGQAAADAKAANIDGVYLHGHEGYLLDQVTNPAFNRRKMGKYSDWQLFGIDMVKEIRRRCGNAYPIMYRIDMSCALDETYGDKMDTEKGLKKFKNGRTAAQTLEYMKNLVKAGVDIFDVDLGCYDNWWLPHPPATMPAGCFLDISKMAKEYFEKENIVSNAGEKVPVVAVGKLGYPDLAEKALRDGQCDMVMLGRPLLADPDWPKKAYANKVEEIRPCIGCQEACINEFVEGGHPQCAVNPRTAFEIEFDAQIPKAVKVKKIAVIGAGPAGITAATTLRAKGHSVDLYEKSGKVGGMLNPGGMMKGKYEVYNYRVYLEKQLEKLSREDGFNVHTNVDITPAQLKEIGYDIVVTALGTKQLKPPVEGIDNKNVVFGVDVLNDPGLVDTAENIVVVGGGVVGCETAYYLKYERGKNVKVLEMMEYFMEGVCTANRGHLIHYLERAGVELMNCARLTKVMDDGIEFVRNVSPTVPDPYVTWTPILPSNIENPLAKEIKVEEERQFLKADLIILSAGAKSENQYYYDCVKDYVAAEIYNIGDSSRAGKVAEAVRAGYRLAMSL